MLGILGYIILSLLIFLLVVVCRLNPIGECSSLSTLVEEGVTVNITSCCEGKFERPIMIGMSCQEIIATDSATIAGKYTYIIMYIILIVHS